VRREPAGVVRYVHYGHDPSDIPAFLRKQAD